MKEIKQERKEVSDILRSYNIVAFRHSSAIGIEGAISDIIRWKDEETNKGYRELTTRLENLVNVIEAILPQFNVDDKSGALEPIFFMKNEARETLKKVIG